MGDNIAVLYQYDITEMNYITPVSVGGVKCDNWANLLKFLYSRLFYEPKDMDIHIAIHSLIDGRDAYLRKTKDLSYGDSKSPYGMFLYPSVGDVCIVLQNLNCEKRRTNVRSSDEIDMTKRYIPSQGKITEISIPPFVQRLKISGESLLDVK